MGRWKSWYCLEYKNSFLSSTRSFLFKLRSCLTNKAKGRKNGLVSLYKDMEACEGYEDIQVMWEMIHTCSPPLINAKNTKLNDKTPYWRFCFSTSPTT